ncbi:MAG: hypothetical protein SFZ03_08600 [Candidatus Melainabacteria bacterium]|nr:hypothetical protein [Candidatus Melainabacteria bacterium]
MNRPALPPRSSPLSQQTTPTPPPEPAPGPESGSVLLRLLGFYLILYVVLVAVMAILYPFASQYTTPFTAVIFDINSQAPLPKVLLIMTGMYWAMVSFFIFINWGKIKG